MLHNVPEQMRRMVRQVLQNHPNSVTCEVYRKKVNRLEDPRTSEEDTVATIYAGAYGESTKYGRPTLGGAGVLESYDEPAYEFDFLGYGWAMPAESFQQSHITDKQDLAIGANEEFSFVVEPQSLTGEDGFFMLQTHDILMLLIGKDPKFQAKMAFEIVAMDSPTAIPPFLTKWICNRRDDLNLIVPTE